MLTRRRFAQASALIAAAGPGLAFSRLPLRFPQGVASGDPQADRVVLWSRVGGYDSAVEATYEVSTTPDFSRSVSRGSIPTGPERDHTLKVDATGLSPGTVYFYRFGIDGGFSTTGRTKTLPGKDATATRFAVVSCSNFPAGFFNVYREIGHHNDLDAVIHLGDYIYEYPADGYASERAAEFDRLSDPAGELLTLSDYRRRYAQYRSDPDLQYAHARVPFIVIWDDHELANDAWMDGAENHGPDEGSWRERRARALQAFYEWMPIREAPDRPLEAAYRSFEFGKLATLAMIETRLSARARPLSYSADLPVERAWFDMSDSRRRPRRIGRDEAARSADALSVRLAYELDSDPGHPVDDYRRLKRWEDENTLPDGYGYLPDTELFEREILTQPGRDLLGSRQFDWLERTFAQSQADGVAWRVLGNQTLVSAVRAPDLDEELSHEEKSALPEFIRALVPLSRYHLPLNLDAWDGYPNDRERLLSLTAGTGNAIVLAGDTHNAWAAPLGPEGRMAAGFELATPSITSPGIAETLKISGERLARLFRECNPQFEYIEMSNRGYVLLRLTAEAARAEFRFVNRIDDRRFFVRTGHEVRLPRRKGR